jgi:hypothetical protein
MNIYTPVGFENTISASEGPQIYAFDQRGHWDRQTLKVWMEKLNTFQNIRVYIKIKHANIYGKQIFNIGC